MTLRRNLSVFLVLLALAPARPARACAYFEPTLFVAPYDPDAEPARFVAGELGVLQPTWVRAYLVVAYRHLAGAPLSPGEQSAVVAYLRGSAPGRAGLDAWAKARETATGQPMPPVVTERAAGYSSYVNCGDDAFRGAATTLDTYVLKFGRNAVETAVWREAQDLVFANCAGADPRIPGPLPASAPAALRHDRAYQIASANFYAGRLDVAQAEFEAIGEDPGSRWKPIAPYLAARAVLRRWTLAEEGKANPARLAEAQSRFSALASGSPSPDVRRWSADLVRFTDLRLEPASRIPGAAARVLVPPSVEEFGPAFVHYRDLLFRVLGYGPEPGGYEPDPKDDLTSWIVAFQDPSPRGLERALAGFSRSHTAPWTLAVLAKIDASHPRAAEVVEAARPLAAAGPGRLHAAYHLARLATEAGGTAEARTLVEANLTRAASCGPSAQNLFLGLKLRNAVTLEEFASAAPRSVVGAESDRNFDEYTRDILNRRLPLEAFVRFAESLSSMHRVSRDVRRVVLTRAILLGRADVARALAPPGAKVRWDNATWRVDAALAVLLEDSESRPYTALDPPFAIAWWCALPGPLAAGREPAFLSPEERRTAAEETAHLAAVAPAATWFTGEALAFAREKPDDPRAPEFLARAVRTTREGCGDGETRSLSKAAFDLLHRRYPKSPWTRQTKYWFEGRGWSPPRPARSAPPS